MPSRAAAMLPYAADIDITPCRLCYAYALDYAPLLDIITLRAAYAAYATFADSRSRYATRGAIRYAIFKSAIKTRHCYWRDEAPMAPCAIARRVALLSCLRHAMPRQYTTRMNIATSGIRNNTRRHDTTVTAATVIC